MFAVRRLRDNLSGRGYYAARAARSPSSAPPRAAPTRTARAGDNLRGETAVLTGDVRAGRAAAGGRRAGPGPDPAPGRQVAAAGRRPGTRCGPTTSSIAQRDAGLEPHVVTRTGLRRRTPARPRWSTASRTTGWPGRRCTTRYRTTSGSGSTSRAVAELVRELRPAVLHAASDYTQRADRGGGRCGVRHPGHLRVPGLLGGDLAVPPGAAVRLGPGRRSPTEYGLPDFYLRRQGDRGPGPAGRRPGGHAGRRDGRPDRRRRGGAASGSRWCRTRWTWTRSRC